MVGIHLVYTTLLYHPGYTYHPALLPVIAVPGAQLPGREALGSALGLVRVMRRIELSRPPKVCRLVGTSAQSPSALPEERLTKIG